MNTSHPLESSFASIHKHVDQFSDIAGFGTITSSHGGPELWLTPEFTTPAKGPEKHEDVVGILELLHGRRIHHESPDLVVLLIGVDFGYKSSRPDIVEEVILLDLRVKSV